MPTITEKHVSSKKRIGTLNGKPVTELVTTGGFYVVAIAKNGHLETLGVGSHRCLARYIAKKREPSLVITELSKSETLSQAAIDSVVVKYEQLTDEVNAYLKG